MSNNLYYAPSLCVFTLSWNLKEFYEQIQHCHGLKEHTLRHS